MKELSGFMEMFPFLTEVCATRGHIFAKIYLTVCVRSVHFTAHQMSFKKEKREQSTCIQNNEMYLQEHKKIHKNEGWLNILQGILGHRVEGWPQM